MDSTEKVRSIDQRDMLGSIERLPEGLADGLRRGRRSGLPRFLPKDIVVCGMGGSSMGGDLLKEWLALSTEVPCHVVRSYSLPAYVGKDSLVIVSSYSGNTEESLSMFEEARKRRAKIVAISSGGQLVKMCESLSVPFAKLPPGMPPRASLGHVLGAMIGVLERSGVAVADKQVEEAIRVMGKAISYCKQSVPTNDNPAKMLAHELYTVVPVIVGYEISRPVAKRWANQLCENGKVLAFSSELPEMDHNEIVGWVKDARSKNFGVVFLDHEARSAQMKKRVKATKDMLGRTTAVYAVDALGLSPLAKMLSLVVVGDYVSTYIGILRSEDPYPTEPIDELKAILSK